MPSAIHPMDLTVFDRAGLCWSSQSVLDRFVQPLTTDTPGELRAGVTVVARIGVVVGVSLGGGVGVGEEAMAGAAVRDCVDEGVCSAPALTESDAAGLGASDARLDLSLRGIAAVGLTRTAGVAVLSWEANYALGVGDHTDVGGSSSHALKNDAVLKQSAEMATSFNNTQALGEIGSLAIKPPVQGH